nr:hypothetical protein [uncultured bacterium]
MHIEENLRIHSCYCLFDFMHFQSGYYINYYITICFYFKLTRQVSTLKFIYGNSNFLYSISINGELNSTKIIS